MSAWHSTSSTPVNPEDALLTGVLCLSLMTTEMDLCHLHFKNTDALRLAIWILECEEMKEVEAKEKGARHAKDKDHFIHRLSDMRCSSDEDDSDASTPGYDDDDATAPPHANAYTEEGHSRVDVRKGKGAARKW
ncbi:hypothetical protein D1007_46600 [Hordeum vulgare]|nr:hypothetical protein D1007_46600 [Hordeum vulgare]